MPVLPPAVLLKSTSTPTPVFSSPLLLASANVPIAVLKLLSVLALSANEPLAVFSLPVVLFRSA
jgi:hypothetical protein